MNKMALVVGGTGGIGSAVVHAFIRNGWRVAVVTRGRNRASFQPDEEQCLTSYLGNVVHQGDMRRIADEFARSHGHADCLIYSVGMPPDVTVPLVDYPLSDWDATFDTYVKGFLVCFQALLPHLNRGGHVVAVGSAITRFPADSLPPIHAGHYAAAKAALAELVKWARREAKSRAVLVSHLSLGAVDTAPHQSGELAGIPKRLLTLV